MATLQKNGRVSSLFSLNSFTTNTQESNTILLRFQNTSSYAPSCKAYKNALGSRVTGVDNNFWIDPDANGVPVLVECDMDTAGGGWTLLQKMSTDDACIPAWNLGSANTLPNGVFSYALGNVTWTNIIQATEVRGSVMAASVNGSASSVSVNGAPYSVSIGAPGDRTPCVPFTTRGWINSPVSTQNPVHNDRYFPYTLLPSGAGIHTISGQNLNISGSVTSANIVCGSGVLPANIAVR